MAHPPLGAARAPPAPAAAQRPRDEGHRPPPVSRSHHHHQPPAARRPLLDHPGRHRRPRSARVVASAGPADWLVPDRLVKTLDPLPPALADEAGALGADDANANAANATAPATPGNATPSNNDTLTVYTMRLTTASARNAGASDPASAVQVLLLSADGRAVLRRVQPLYDPSDAERQARHICSVVVGAAAEAVGADCSRFLQEEEEEKEKAEAKNAATTAASTAPAPPPRPAPPGPVRPRFQPGAVDEVSFLAPDLGHPLAAMVVAPESGTWMLDEATVSSSRTGRSDRFVCRALLGSGAPGAARAADRRSGRGGASSSSPSSSSTGPAYLTPVAAGAVVVGEGSAARALTRAEAEALHERGMDGYGRLKGRVTAATAALAAGGSLVAGLVGGPGAAAPFALGGLAGLGYWALLQLGVAAALPPEGAALMEKKRGGEEAAGAGEAADEPRSPSPLAASAARPTGSPLIRFLGSGPFRVAAVGAVAVIAASAARYWTPAGGVGPAASTVGGGGGGGRGGSSLEAPLVAGNGGGSPHSALRPWQLGLAVAGFLSYKVAVVAVGAGMGGGGEDEGGGGGGGNGGNGGAGGGGSSSNGAALSARELEAMLAMRAPSPAAGDKNGEDGEEDD